MRLAFPVIMLFCLAPAMAAGEGTIPAPAVPARAGIGILREHLPQAAFPRESVIDAACCKICSKGKACGNSCISPSRQCHRPRGCACDG